MYTRSGRTHRRGLRSFPHLREQLKPRTDDGHATPVTAQYPSCISTAGRDCIGISSLGKVLRLSSN